jgi:hypothetical protein
MCACICVCACLYLFVLLLCHAENSQYNLKKFSVVYTLIWYFVSPNYRFVKGKGNSGSLNAVVMRVTVG